MARLTQQGLASTRLNRHRSIAVLRLTCHRNHVTVFRISRMEMAVDNRVSFRTWFWRAMHLIWGDYIGP